MDLWIRNQTKRRLLKIDELDIVEPLTARIQWSVYSHDYCLGEYSSKERCFEILDEIQKIMNVDPMGLLLANDCIIGEDCYKGVVKQFKENGLGAICIAGLGLHNARIQYIPKNFIVYEMPEE